MIYCFDLDGTSVGIAGSKGFVGGFPDWELPNFGEPLLRQLYEATTAEIDKLRRALAEIAGCDVRIAMLHYAPTSSTLDGEPQVIWPFLGSHRLGHPILEARPDLVLHGHAHEGTFEGRIGDVPVLNVAVPAPRVKPPEPTRTLPETVKLPEAVCTTVPAVSETPAHSRNTSVWVRARL